MAATDSLIKIDENGVVLERCLGQVTNEMNEGGSSCGSESKDVKEELNELKLRFETLAEEWKQLKRYSTEEETLSNKMKKNKSLVELETEVEQQNNKFNEISESLTSSGQQIKQLKTKNASEKQSLKTQDKPLRRIIKLSFFFLLILIIINNNQEIVRQTAELMEIANKLNEIEGKMNFTGIETFTTPMIDEQLASMPEVFEWNIGNIEDKLKAKEQIELKSEEFQVTEYGFTAQASLKLSKTANEISLCNYNCSEKSKPKVVFVIKDQSEMNDKQDIYCTDYRRFKPETSLRGSFKNLTSRYVKKNSLKIKIFVEPVAIARTRFSTNGVLLWKIDNYMTRLRMMKEGRMRRMDSPYFYTSPNGYKVFVAISLFKSSFTAYLNFLPGEYDSFLTLDFPHCFTITVINQKDQSKSLIMSKDGREAYLTHISIENISAFESDVFVKDDALYIKVVVEPSN